jgi:hypothetical protein
MFDCHNRSNEALPVANLLAYRAGRTASLPTSGAKSFHTTLNDQKKLSIDVRSVTAFKVVAAELGYNLIRNCSVETLITILLNS